MRKIVYVFTVFCMMCFCMSCDGDKSEKQAMIDSLLVQCDKEIDDSNYVAANIKLKQCVELCETEKLFDRNWEMYYLKARIISVSASSIKESWENDIKYLKLAFDSWDKKSEGVAVKADRMLNGYAQGLAQKFVVSSVGIVPGKVFEEAEPDSIDHDLYPGNENYEEEFISVIKYLMEKDKYKALCNSGRYYIDNFAMAENYFKKAIKQDTTKCLAYQYLGRLYSKNNMNDKAIDILLKSLGKCEDNIDKGYSYRLLALRYPYFSEERVNYFRLSAQLGDKDAINYCKENNIDWH